MRLIQRSPPAHLAARWDTPLRRLLRRLFHKPRHKPRQLLRVSEGLVKGLVKGLVTPLVRVGLKIWLIISMTATLASCEGPANNHSLHYNSLIYCSEGSPVSFNPQLASSGTTTDAVANTLYNVLLRANNETGEFNPELATAWHVSDDGKTYVFELRKNVVFHQTDYFTPSRLFNADDVLFSFRRTIDPRHPYHFVNGGNYRKQFGDTISTIRAINPHRVEFKLDHPDSTFLYNLATDYSVILSQEYADFLYKQDLQPQIDRLPIGTGPFKFQEYKRDELIRYYRHERYWQNTNNFEQLIFDITKSSPARLAKLLTHECDIAAYPPPHQLPLLEQRADITVSHTTALNVSFWAFNTAKPPFNNILVRKALAHAVNLDGIIAAVFHGFATKADSILPPSSWGYHKNEQPIQYNPEKAKQLLKQAGYSNGFSMEIWATPILRDYIPNAYKVAELMQSDLAKIGVKVDIVTYDWATFRKRLSNGEHDSVIIGWAADHADPDNFFSTTLTCSAKMSGANRAQWCDPKFDELLSDALIEQDVNQRKAIYRRVQALLNQEVPLFPIAHSHKFQAHAANIKGLQIFPYGAISFENARKE